MLRRNLRGATINFGSLADYGSTKYDFTIPPTPKQHIKTEVGEKTINLLYSAVEDL